MDIEKTEYNNVIVGNPWTLRLRVIALIVAASFIVYLSTYVENDAQANIPDVEPLDKYVTEVELDAVVDILIQYANIFTAIDHEYGIMQARIEQLELEVQSLK